MTVASDQAVVGAVGKTFASVQGVSTLALLTRHRYTLIMSGPTVQRDAAKQRALSLVKTIRAIGVVGSLRSIAAALNERGVPTPKGAQWHSTSVARILERAGITPGVDVLPFPMSCH